MTPAELKALVMELLGRVRDLERQVAARDAEIARLKGLKGRPEIRPSGMEQGAKAPSATPAGPRRGGGDKTARRSIHEERVIKAAVPPGSGAPAHQQRITAAVTEGIPKISQRPGFCPGYAAMLPRLTWAAVRTPPMPYRLLKLAEVSA